MYKYDISLPLRQMYAIVEQMREQLREHNCVVVGYGHLGDANLHLNVPESARKLVVKKEKQVQLQHFGCVISAVRVCA